MTDDKLNITIRIAGQSPMALKINRADEERVRNAEYQVNRLWGRWRERYTDKSSMEVLAMVAYQFAELFFGASKASEEVDGVLKKFEEDLDGMLHGFGADLPAASNAPEASAKGQTAAETKTWSVS